MCASKSRSDFPREEIWLDSPLSLLFEEPSPLVAHTDFSAHIQIQGKRQDIKVQFIYLLLIFGGHFAIFRGAF